MTKTIDTLETDISLLLTQGANLSAEVLAGYGVEVGAALDRQLSKAGKVRARPPKTVFASEIGQFDTCPRKLWFSFHKPELGEEFTGNVRMKFIYGDIIEETVLTLAKAAGHDVKFEQGEIVMPMPRGYTLIGHIDAVVDGVLVDVKSTTSQGLKTFLEGRGGDKFGYRAQLNIYADALGIKDKGWIAVDKQLGHIKFVREDKPYSVPDLMDKVTEVLELSHPMLIGGRVPVPEGTSGNEKLDVECSYCAYKKECFPKMRTFRYSTGPVYLTRVVKEPRVPELVT